MFDKHRQLSGNLDYKAIRKLLDYIGICDDKIATLPNEMATTDNIIDAIGRLADSSAVFIQGHAERGSSDVEYITYDYYMSDPAKGLACSELCENLLLSNNGNPTQRFLLSDFCLNYNFNNLRYVLEIGCEKPPRWVQSPDWYPNANLYDGNDTLVHFAAGSPGQKAHESPHSGGFFTQGFCKSMTEPRTLPELLEAVRNHVEESMHLANLNQSLQVPQIYSSHRLDLNDVNIMKMFGFLAASTPIS